MHGFTHYPRSCRGFGLIEVLVAVLILSIGLLGLASLQANGMRFNHSSYLRTQATVLAYDILDTMRANRGSSGKPTTALGGGYVTTYADTHSGSEGSEADLQSWKQRLATLLPEGEGQITQNAAEFTINVRWTERGGTPSVFSLITSL